MNVTRLEFPDASFDAAVATFLFCTLPDELQVPALRELGRAVKPNGIIRLLDYTRPHGGIRRATEQHIPDAGLTLIGARFVVDDLIRLIEAKPRA